MINPPLHGMSLNAILHLKAEFPAFLRTFRKVDLPVDGIELEFFQEEVAMDCAEKLMGIGISCVYTLDKAKILSFPLYQDQGEENVSRIVSALENIFQALNFRWHTSYKAKDSL